MSLKSKRTSFDPQSMISHSNPIQSVPWPQWLDSELNAEKWESPKNGPDGKFQDTQSIIMPASLQPHAWERASKLTGLTDAPVVYVPTVNFPDFIENNKHILHSEFVRWFVSTMINLQHYGRNGLQVAEESNNFVWLGSALAWQGWLYVYSLNKAGKSAYHDPTFNSHGKYVVRLFYMGFWRRFLIDDMIPVDNGGNVLLPRTGNNFELWPMILCKALLKIASMSWTTNNEIRDFDPVACFTGWIGLSLDTSHLSPMDKWEFLTKYAQHFEWPVRSDKTTDTSSTKKSAASKRRKPEVKSISALENPSPVVIFATLTDMRDVAALNVPGVAPCWSHPVYIELSRDIPLDPKEVKPPLAKWKLYRWLNWSIRHGLIDPAEYFVPIRCLKMVSPLREFKESLIYTYESDENAKGDWIEEPEARNVGKYRTKMVADPFPIGSLNDKRFVSDISLWGDFNKMTSYIMKIQLFYKSWQFSYFARISNILPDVQDDEKMRTGSRDTRKTTRDTRKEVKPDANVFLESLKWRHDLSKSRNEPLYLFVDSLEVKFLLLNFTAMQAFPPSSDPGTENYSYLAVLKANFFKRLPGNFPLAVIRTYGTGSTVLEVDPGRHIFRIFIRSKFSYFLTISSDTIFHIGNRQKMFDLMTKESERLEELARKIFIRTVNAFQAFGKADYKEKLKNLYKAYMPQDENIKTTEFEVSLKKSIHHFFLEELHRAVEENLTNDLIGAQRALRIFFIDPYGGMKTYPKESEISLVRFSSSPPGGFLIGKIERGSREQEIEEQEFIPVDYDRAATIIQSFFRMILVRSYKKKHDPTHKEHFHILDDLGRIAESLDYAKNESIWHQLVRDTIKRDNRFKGWYPCSEDFQHVLSIQECKGILINVTQDQWVPIVRLVVNPAKFESVFPNLNLFVNLPSYTLRVFNNDTGRELEKIINNVVPMHYKHRKHGYTIFGYGWSGNSKFRELNWALKIITMKGESVLYTMNDDPEPISEKTQTPNLWLAELSNNYIPNIEKLIARWIIEAKMKSIVSFRLVTSYEMVEIKFRVINQKGHVISESKGTSVVILPHAFLNQDIDELSKEESVTEVTVPEVEKYYLEAYVLNDSWPLTETEWSVVKRMKRRETVYSWKSLRMSSFGGSKLSKSELSRLRKISKRSSDSPYTPENPYWILQTVSDVGSGVNVAEDKGKEEELTKIKAEWERNEPGRLERGKTLRENFLNDNCLVISASIMSQPAVSMSPSGHAVPKSRPSSHTDGSLFPLLKIVETRTLTPPKDIHKFLPKLDISIYIDKENEEENRWLKNENDEEMLRNLRMINLFDFKQSESVFWEEMEKLMKGQAERNSLLLNYYQTRFEQRRNLMSEAYGKRSAYFAEANKMQISKVNASTKKKK